MEKKARGALAGIRVVDLTRLLPGPFASLYLADMGAEVIKVEDTRYGDPIRGYVSGNSGPSSYFIAVNRGKKSVALDFRRPRGRDVLLALARRADVFLEGFRPGVAQALGFGYQALSELNPRLVYCSLTGYGQEGPLRGRAGHDINYLAQTGLLALSGKSEGAPSPLPVQVGDLAGAMAAAIGILAGLYQRERSGTGCYIDAAMVDVLFSWLALPASRLLVDGHEERGGEQLLGGGIICYNVYATRDGAYVALGALEPKFWEAFCRAVGREDLMELQMSPATPGEAAFETMREIFAARTRDEWQAFGEDHDICLTPVLGLREALEGALSETRQSLARVQDQTGRSARQVRFPLLFATPDSPALLPAEGSDQLTGAPELGQHTEEVLMSAGFSPSDIRALRTDGLIL